MLCSCDPSVPLLVLAASLGILAVYLLPTAIRWVKAAISWVVRRRGAVLRSALEFEHFDGS